MAVIFKGNISTGQGWGLSDSAENANSRASATLNNLPQAQEAEATPLSKLWPVWVTLAIVRLEDHP